MFLSPKLEETKQLVSSQPPIQIHTCREMDFKLLREQQLFARRERTVGFN